MNGVDLWALIAGFVTGIAEEDLHYFISGADDGDGSALSRLLFHLLVHVACIVHPVPILLLLLLFLLLLLLLLLMLLMSLIALPSLEQFHQLTTNYVTRAKS